MGPITGPGDLNASLNANGLYNSIQFVLRLSPEIHRRIAKLPSGIISGPFDFDDIQAYSTYLHETIHWWQHIGSTSGLILSLAYPAQAHANYSHLKNLLKAIGPKKSIRRLVEILGPSAPSLPVKLIGLANIILNNYYDIEFFRILMTDVAEVQKVIENPFFETIGHSCQITYSNVLAVLESTIDRNFKTIPDPRKWDRSFGKLRTNGAKGYVRGSRVEIASIAAKDIFEGQARFGQLQYLHFSTQGKFEWQHARDEGMLFGVYESAFKVFLRLAKLEWPSSIDHPTVALFMLVCDLAINPSTGFPMQIKNFDTFFEDVNPGIRFIKFCRIIDEKFKKLKVLIRHYTRDEYAMASEFLCKCLSYDSPLLAAETVKKWVADSEELKCLMTEYQTFNFSPENQSVRFVFSHFLDFYSDKLMRPEYFCWPGVWLAGEKVSNEEAKLFSHHSAPFVDKADNDGIFPRIYPGKDKASVQKTFERFYAFNVTCELTHQWIAKPGPFEFNLKWLSSLGNQADFKNFSDRHFKMLYGISLDDFEII